MKLVIAEKPSVAQSIAAVLGAKERKDGYVQGNGYIVSWCVGHLVESAPPDRYDESLKEWKLESLPIIPDNWQYNVSESTKKQFDVLKNLMDSSDVDSLVCATDAGREGELIFRLVYNKCGCKKPFERLWISSMEDKAIKDGFDNLKPGTDYDNLYRAAVCREHADWLVGINGTRLFSCLYKKKLNVGRVMTPTLAMVVMRDASIAAFKPEPFYTVSLALDGFTAQGERLKDKSEAENLAALCKENGAATVKTAEKKEKSEKAPALYDLTSLQRDANRILGFTAQQTLDYTQSLYEKKLATYPRTDSRYLTDDMEAMLPELVAQVQNAFAINTDIPAEVNAKQVINSAKVSDHHAIIPTPTAVTCDLKELPSGERAILMLIARRLICAVSAPYKYLETTIELTCAEKIFKTKGRTVISDGFKVYEEKKTEKSEDEEETNNSLPDVSEGNTLPLTGATVKEGMTTPPKKYTEDTLLSAMESAGADEMPDEAERKGIGAPATRAATIEKLVKIGFIERKGDKKTKHLVSTKKGNALITVVPEQIQSPLMTADWEEKLLEVERGNFSSDEFMEEIRSMIKMLIDTYEPVKDASLLFQSEQKIIGKCPKCGADVAIGKFGAYCKNKCGMNVSRAMGTTLTEAQIKSLLEGKKTLVKGLQGKKGSYDAYLVPDGTEDFSFEKDGKEIKGTRWKLKLEFPQRKDKKDKEK